MRWLNKPVPKAVECLFPTTFSRILIFSGANHPDFIGCIGCIHTCALTSNLSKIRHFDKNLAKRILYCCEKKGVNHRWIYANHANNDKIFLRIFFTFDFWDLVSITELFLTIEKKFIKISWRQIQISDTHIFLMFYGFRLQ